MKVNITINLEVDAPDTTGFAGDTEYLLDLVKKSISMTIFEKMSPEEFVSFCENGHILTGNVKMALYDSKGTYRIQGAENPKYIKDETEELKKALLESTALLVKIKGAMFLRGVRFYNVSDTQIENTIKKNEALLDTYLAQAGKNG